MAETAFMKVYREESIAKFEQMQSLLRDTCTTDGVVSGNELIFHTAGSGGLEAVTRGVNGQIPYQAADQTQTTCTLTEWHGPASMTNYNLFASQGPGRDIMQRISMAKINRKMDQQIITELNTASVNTGAVTTATLQMVTKSIAILGNAEIPWDNNITGLITPSFLAYLMQVPEFSNADYINGRPTPTNEGAWSDRPKVYQWLGVNWIVHPNLPGKATNAEKCFLYHKSSIGHGANVEGLKVAAGYDEKQDESWARATCYMGAKVIQNPGIVVMNHDGSAHAPA